MPISSHPTTSDLFIRQSTPKSLSRETFLQDLAGDQSDDYSSMTYVNWLALKVLPTVKRSDLADSLTEWHQLSEWEKILTSIVRVTDLHVQFDVPDGFDILPLVFGFLSCDFEFLATCPGVDADRRIARCVLFADWAWNTLVGSMSDTDSSDKAAVFTTINAVSLESHLPLAVGGAITENATPDHRDGATSSASPAGTSHCSERVCHLCGETAAKRCSRCDLVRYCSRQCQAQTIGIRKHMARTFILGVTPTVCRSPLF